MELEGEPGALTPLMQAVYARSERVGKCLEWQGAMNSAGHPVMRWPLTNPGLLVRRLIAMDMGRRMDGLKVRMKCQNARCVEPSHIALTSHRAIMVQAALDGRLSGPKKSASCKVAARKHGKLSDEKVAEIRASTDTLKTLAQRHGVSVSTVWQAKAGVSWAPVKASSAFAWRPSASSPAKPAAAGPAGPTARR